MKKVLMAVVLLFFVVGFSYAEIQLPDAHAGVVYSMTDHAINHVETVSLVNIQDILYVEGGYAGDSDNSDHKAIIALTGNIKQLQVKNYVDLPILNLIEFRPALYVGLGHINLQGLDSAKLDWGVGATFITAKW